LRRDLDTTDRVCIKVDRDFVGLGEVETDIEGFEQALESGNIAVAAGLWRSEFAEGVDLDSDAWATWREDVRGRLRLLALGMFERLARDASNDRDRVLAAEGMSKLDPFNEVAVQLLLPPLVRMRGVAVAVTWYDGFVERLKREKARQPLPETAAIYASLVEVRGAGPAPSVDADRSKGRQLYRAVAASIALIFFAIFGGAIWFLQNDDDREQKDAAEATFIEPTQLRWPFRFHVAEPRGLDRNSATASALETLAEDLRNALGVMPGSALSVTPVQADFTMESDVRSGAGERLAINLRLVERATGRVLWADTLAGVERYAGGFPEQRVIPVETAIARAYAALLVEMDRRRPQIPTPAPEVADAVRQGWTALRGGANRQRVADSDAAFRRAFELDPESPEARIGMAHSLAMHLLNFWTENRAEDAATASRLIGETIDRSARQPIAFFVQGLVHKSQRDYARGLAAMRVTLQIQPQHSASYAQSAHMHLLSGDADRALEMAELGVLLGPEANALDRALLYAGMARLLVGDYPAAVRHLERSFGINKTFADVYAWYAAALYRAGKSDEARDVYRQMRTRWPTHRVDHHVLISHSPQRLERFSVALAELESLAALDAPRSATPN
jgi:Flp pilus assembly protein TadD